MDADVQLTAATLKIPEQIPLENFSTHVKLNSGLLVLDPLNFGMAGGNLVSTITLDARSNPIAAKASIDLRRVRLGQLFPTIDTIKNTSTGSVGAQIRLAGRGNSIADMMATSDGTMNFGMAGGRVSELGVWLVNLHGGELLPLLFGGDRPTQIRCGAAAFTVDDGLATLGLFVFDTDESNIGGSGHGQLARREVRHHARAASPRRRAFCRCAVRCIFTARSAKSNFGVSGQTVGRGLSAVALGPRESVAGIDSVDRNRPGTKRRLSGGAGDGQRGR